ncbi:MAG: hypothetical protein ACKOKF_12010 [Bacteroidota bacterium]
MGVIAGNGSFFRLFVFKDLQMKSKALKKRLGLQVILNLEEVFTQESPRVAKAMRKSLKSAAKSLVKEFLKRSKAIEKAEDKPKSPGKRSDTVKSSLPATVKSSAKLPVKKKKITKK